MSRELNEKVHILTRNPKTLIQRDTDEGSVGDYVDELSLLNQLDAFLTMNGKGGGSSAGGSKAPMSLMALDLCIEIDRVAASHADHHLPVPIRIQTWAQKATGDAQRESECLAWVTHWCDQISALFDSKLELDAECPTCGSRYSYEQDEGDATNTIRRLALVATIRRANCRNCKAEWLGLDGLRVLSSVL